MTTEATHTTQASTPNRVTWPAHDPSTWRTMPEAYTPLDPDRIESLLATEWERFAASTPESGALSARSRSTLPLGVPSSFQYWDPHPVSVVSAKGAWLTDVDGRRLLDLSMGFGAMLVGHLNPAVVAAVQQGVVVHAVGLVEAAEVSGEGVDVRGLVTADQVLVERLQGELAGAGAGRLVGSLAGCAGAGRGLVGIGGVHGHPMESSTWAISTATRAASMPLSVWRARACSSFSTVRMALAMGSR